MQCKKDCQRMPSQNKITFELRWYNENLTIQKLGGIAFQAMETEMQRLWNGYTLSVFEEQQGDQCD